MVGRPLGDARIFPDAVMERLQRGGALASLETTSRHKDGTESEVTIFGAPLYRSSAPGYAIMAEDITGRKAYERERAEILASEREARKEAESANRMKDEFLATLSHELRTPLNAIMGWMSMLRQPVLDEAGRARAMDIIERNLRSQQQLVSDILEVSQIIRGRMRLETQVISVVDAVVAAIDAVAPAAAARRLSIRQTLPEAPLFVSGDAERLQQVFWNLLSNAVKYTPRDGSIEVVVSGKGGDVEVTVRDSGTGIDPEILPHIFDRFRQGESGPTRTYGGLGLGLSIVRHLSEAHGGSVRAESEGLGKGSTFVVTLPRA
jgi:signal transduction histidine kinase